MPTTSQRMAQAAYSRVADQSSLTDEYRSFAREFPSLVHSCGLAQAVAFARAKGGQQQDYVGDLAAVLMAAGHADVGSIADLEAQTRGSSVGGYLRLSRNALAAAVWIKRYVEARKKSGGTNPAGAKAQGT